MGEVFEKLIKRQTEMMERLSAPMSDAEKQLMEFEIEVIRLKYLQQYKEKLLTKKRTWPKFKNKF